jgi:hypothetical protein
MSNPANLDDVLAELTAIRLILSARPVAAPAQTATAPQYAQSTASSDGPPSQPSQVIENPGDVLVHFGKNKDKPLSELSERSLSWYASEQPPRLDNAGKPFPPRPVEITLRNAARTLWHTRAGTLGAAAVQAAPAKVADGVEENVPF